MTHLALTSTLQTLKRRVLAIGLGAGTGWGLLGGLLFVLVCVWLDLLLELPAQMRLAAGWCAVVIAAAMVAWIGLAALRRSALDAIARRLDDAAGTRGQIRSGVDLLMERQARSGLSGGLARLAVDRAAGLAISIPSTQAAPSRPVALAFGSFATLCLGLVILGMFMPRLAGTQWARFVHPFDDVPPYTRLLLEVEPGDVKVVYGDGLDIYVTAEGAPVEKVELVLRTEAGDDEVLPLFPEPDGRWRATIGQVTQAGSYFARAHRARSRQFDIGVITVPRIETVRFRVTPPAYTNLGAYEGPLPQGGLAGLAGTRVDAWIESNRPLSGGTIDLAPAEGEHEQRDMSPVARGSREVTGYFEITASGKVHLTVRDVAGQPCREPFTATVTLLADERPFVRLLEPQEVSLATPDVELPVAISAEDDYGISRLQVYRSLNESRALPTEMSVPRPAATRYVETLSLPLSSYGLKPGDEIKLFARVEDNDPAGPKGSESPLAVVRIISQADYQRLMLTRQGMEVLQSKYQQAQRRLEGLAEEMERILEELRKQPPDSELSKELQREMERLTRQMEKDAAEIRVAAMADLPYDLDKYLSPQLSAMANMLEEAARELRLESSPEKKAGEPSRIPKAGGIADKLEQALAGCKGGKKEFEEEVSEPLEHLAKIYPLLEDEARYLNLYAMQRGLAERLASLKGRDGEDDPKLKGRMRDLQAEQKQLREELVQLLDDLEDHVAQLPEDERLDDLRRTASEFAVEVRASGAAEAMADAEDGLADFSGTRGHEHANEAADILEQFIGKCKGTGEAGRSCLKFGPTLSAGLGNTVSQLLSDAGMKPGMMGKGSGGGYSASRTSLDNVGLYGSLPTLNASGGGAGKDALNAPFGQPWQPGTDGTNPDLVAPGGSLEARGGSSAFVPVRYRTRVGAYFQRIADEVGE